MQRVVYFVGTEAEVAHHAAPLRDHFDGTNIAVEVTGVDQVVAKATSRDLAVFFSEHFDRFREAVAQLKSKNIATLYLIDGILEWRNAWENRDDEPACPYAMRPVLAHKVAAIGQSQARTLRTWGNDTKIEVVGVPRFDLLRTQWLGSKGTSSKETGSKKAESESSLRNDNKAFRILVMTAKTPGFTESQITLTRQSLIDLKTFFDQNPIVGGRKIGVTWRLSAGLENSIGVENELTDLSGVELATVLNDVDAVISTPSTAMLEAMLFRKPVASLDYHACPKYVQTAWEISSRGRIESTIHELLDPPARHILFQNSQLQDALALSELATERLSQLIQAMLAVVDEAAGPNKPLEFPANLLCSPRAKLDSETDLAAQKLNHAAVFPHAEEFRETELVEVQTQLSHARREIKHLQREKKQLESELGQAHEIFAQIHSHPIAGPIVRLRETFMQFFKRNKKQTPIVVDTPETSTTSVQQETN